ncbi:DUF202 domain-containing protein [Kineococcus gypseus]|uniref:DUF202 domain-containing protein n=1 Tax=Kineococcus gypseus TaxID=1637102 RepID=UPI003D7E6015
MSTPGGSRRARRAVFDAGLQPERTALAWRRTALSLVAVSLGAARLLPAQLGPGAVALGLAGAVAGVLVHVLAGRRARRLTERLVRSGDLDSPAASAGLAALTAATCALLGLAGVVLIVAHGLDPRGA